MGGGFLYPFMFVYLKLYSDIVTEDDKIKYIIKHYTAYELYAILDGINFESDNIRNAYITSFNNRKTEYDKDITTAQLNEIIEKISTLSQIN